MSKQYFKWKNTSSIYNTREKIINIFRSSRNLLNLYIYWRINVVQNPLPEFWVCHSDMLPESDEDDDVKQCIHDAEKKWQETHTSQLRIDGGNEQSWSGYYY